jgi:hypothetical protein
VEVAASVVLEDDRLAVDQRVAGREAANRRRDPRKAVREVGAAADPDLDALALLAGEDAEARRVLFHAASRIRRADRRQAPVRTGK